MTLTPGSRTLVGLFGGTFDPVHQGHVQMALEAKQALGLETLILIPSYQNPLKHRPQLTGQQRLHLLTLALAPLAGLKIDDRELRRQGPSYTVATLRELREELGDETSLVLFMGVDTYAQLMDWHEWQSLTDLGHIAVITRPGYCLPATGVLADWLAASSINEIAKQPAGQVIHLALTPMDISSTDVRQQLAMGLMPEGLPQAVATYIKDNQLYGFRDH